MKRKITIFFFLQTHLVTYTYRIDVQYYNIVVSQ